MPSAVPLLLTVAALPPWCCGADSIAGAPPSPAARDRSIARLSWVPSRRAAPWPAPGWHRRPARPVDGVAAIVVVVLAWRYLISPSAERTTMSSRPEHDGGRLSCQMGSDRLGVRLQRF
ncbi:hypothetical protein K505DRAFT_335905 [Melanomma pulvis-pyrius CBS 109.77]|uniref:Secreted protein n=1 Tax=Melanomma pulvis-pyrius CBS 109.77 TaxID=1314802 RepID=A0A6A6XHN6_9PLEO|nr:hypothetical protein K505DRAFT_335905 [Melanomma pulvis-pyrius CBS 109.77]